MCKSANALPLLLATLFCSFTGCLDRGPSPVAAPDWDVEGITDKAMAQCDEDGDGLLTNAELENAPGFRHLFPAADR